MSMAARRSACPSARVRSACTIRPERNRRVPRTSGGTCLISIRLCPMKHSMAPAPGDFLNSRPRDRSSTRASRSTDVRHENRLRHCGCGVWDGSWVRARRWIGQGTMLAIHSHLADHPDRRPCRAPRCPEAGSSSSTPFATGLKPVPPSVAHPSPECHRPRRDRRAAVVPPPDAPGWQP